MIKQLIFFRAAPTFTKMSEIPYEEAIILVFDGLSPYFIRNHMERLENFSKLAERGFFGELISNIPPITVSCAASFLTGASSEMTGIFDFRRFDRLGLKEGELVFANKVGIPTVIDLANELGFSIGVFNVPFISPPFRVRKGFIVAGFPLSKASRFAYPDSLLEELRKYELGPEVNVPHELSEESLRKPLEDMYQRWKLFLRLRETYRPKLSIVWLSEIDHISHFAWDNEDLMTIAYQKADNILGEAMDLLKKDRKSLLLVASDHGFMNFDGSFLINSFLEKRGLLSLKRSLKTRFKRMFTKLLLGLREGSKSVGGMTWRESTVTRLVKKFLLSRDDVNLDESIAIGIGPLTGYCLIYLLKYSDSDLVEVVDALKSESYVKEVLVDPGKDGPDLIVHLEDGLACDHFMPWSPDHLRPALKALKGIHHIKGVFGLWGKGVVSCPDFKVGIEDILPTALAALGLPVMNTAEGRIRFECFDFETQIRQNIQKINLWKFKVRRKVKELKRRYSPIRD